MLLPVYLCLALSASASAAVARKSAACPSYVLINARGTGEPAGESIGFVTMNDAVEKAVPGGSIYNVKYPASVDQDSSQGTKNIIKKVNAGVAANPAACFILEGYSQGAAAVVNALPKLKDASFSAVKGIVLLGNPEHKSGLDCNVDQNGGNTTKFVNGIEDFDGFIPANWVSKTLDICWFGDGVCDTRDGVGITPEHLEYPGSATVQNMGAKYIIGQLTS